MLPEPSRSRSIPVRAAAADDAGGGNPARRLKKEVSDRLSGSDGTGEAVAAALTAAAGQAVERWVRSRSPSTGRLVRGAAAGIGAAGILYLLRRMTDDPPGLDLTDELLAGAGKGLAYAAVLEPFLPGPPVLRGALLGTLEYLTAPWGGTFSRIQRLSPARKLPIVGALLEAGDAEDDPFVAFVVYGIALGILYGEGELA